MSLAENNSSAYTSFRHKRGPQIVFMTVTIENILHETHQRLQAANLYYGHGSDNAWDEAVFLVLTACRLPLDSGDEVLKRPLTPEEQERIALWQSQRIDQQRPLPYITQEAWFAGLPYYVDERVLIPRSPFAEWINQQFRPWCRPEQLKHILEIGTGSGCIAIATAMALPFAKIDAVDISPAALEVAKKNIARYGMENRVTLYQSDVFNELPKKTYDLILSNPPYVSEDEMRDLPGEYLHEPAIALKASNEGMAVVDRILSQAKAYLMPHGILMVEVGYSQAIFNRHYPNLDVVWLEQTYGGEGIFCISYENLEF